MSVLSKVFADTKRYKQLYGEDDKPPLVASRFLSEEDKAILLKELEVRHELTPKYGARPDFDDIVEREIYARGLETE